MSSPEQKIILLVEDEVIIAMDEAETIRRFGYEVLSANTCAEAVKTATGHSRIDLILMDIDLGSEADGTEAARRILEKRNVPIVFLTSHAEREMVEKVRGITRYGYVIKNSGDFVLQSSIEMAFELFGAHEKMRENEARMHTLVQTIPELFWLKDVNGVYLACNLMFERLYGAREADIIGKTDYDFVDKDLADFFRFHDRKAMEAGGPGSNEEWITFADDGHKALLETIKTPLVDKDGKLIGVLGIARDITERKRAEEERAAHLKFFESMDRITRAVEGTSDLEQMMSDFLDAMLSIFGSDRAWLLYPCDPEAASFRVLMERTRPEYPGAFAMRIDIPMDPDAARVLRTMLASSAPVSFGPGSEHPLPADLAKFFNIQSQIQMVLYPAAGKPWVLGMHQCSYPRVWTQEEQKLFQETGRRLALVLTSLLTYRDLRENEGRLRGIIDNSPAGYFFIDLEGRFRRVNEAWLRMHGYDSPDEAIGLHYSLTQVETDLEGAQLYFEKLLAGQRISTGLFTRRCRDGSIGYHTFSANPVIRDGTVTGLEGFIIDTTDRMLAEMALGERERYSQSLLRLSRALERSDSYEEVVTAARDEVKSVIGYNNLWVYLLTEDREHYKALTISGPISETVISEKDIATLSIRGDRMLEEIASSKDIVIIEDAQTDDRTNKVITAVLGNRTIVNIPIILFERNMGSVGTGTFGDEGVRVPTKSEQEFLSAMASHMAITLDRIHLLAERRRTEEELRLNSERLEQAEKHALLGSWEFDVATGQGWWSKQMYRMFSLEPSNEVPGSGEYLQHIHPEDRYFVQDVLEKMSRSEEPLAREFRTNPAFGPVRYFIPTVYTERDPDGRPLKFIGTQLDITRLKLAEAQIRNLLKEKELLLKEVHHRVKNNMNTIMSLLRLHYNTLKNPEAALALRDAANRVQGMALLYDKLYISDDFKSISMKEYFTPLVNEIAAVFPNRESVKTEIRMGEVILDPKKMFLLGIIINELITNAMKHAFIGRDAGTIGISASQAGNHATVVVHDDGIGLPEPVKPGGSTGFGLQLVGMLAEQIGGSMRIEGGAGTKCILEFDV